MPEPPDQDQELSGHVLGNLEIDVPPDIAAMARAWCAATVPLPLVTKWEEHLHVTVKYGLHTTNARLVEDACRGAKPIALSLGLTHVFVQPDQDVLVVLVHSPELVDMHARLDARLSWQDTNRPYIPHMTLAILTRGSGAPFADLDRFNGQRWTAEALVFRPKAEIADPTAIPLTAPIQGGWNLEFTERELADPLAALDTPYFPRRALSSLERLVAFDDIDARQKTSAKAIVATLQPLVHAQIDALADRLSQADVTGVTGIRAPGVGKVAMRLRPFLEQVYRFGRQCVRDELRRQVDLKGLRGYALAEPMSQQEVFDYITARADFLSERWANRLKDIAAETRLKGERLRHTAAQIRDAILVALGAALTTWFVSQIISSIVESYALGRQIETIGLAGSTVLTPTSRITPIPPEIAAQFTPVPTETPQGGPATPPGPPAPPPPAPPGPPSDPDAGIYPYDIPGIPLRLERGQRSAILDKNLCPHCATLDGVIAPLDDPRLQVPDPWCHGARGSRICRCVVILIAE